MLDSIELGDVRMVIGKEEWKTGVFLGMPEIGVVPRFIDVKIKTRDPVGPNDQRVVNGDKRLCLHVLSSIIRK